MAFIFALGSASLLGCTPDDANNEVNESLDQNEFIDRVSERNVFEEWDDNDDNQLSEDEWSRHDQYNLIYESWDEDGDGQLSENEFHDGLLHTTIATIVMPLSQMNGIRLKVLVGWTYRTISYELKRLAFNSPAQVRAIYYFYF